MGHYPNTALFNPPPKKIFFPLAGEWPKLFRENNVEITRFDGGGGGVPLFLAIFFSPPNSNGLLLSTFQARTNPEPTPDPSFSQRIYCKSASVSVHPTPTEVKAD